MLTHLTMVSFDILAFPGTFPTVMYLTGSICTIKNISGYTQIYLNFLLYKKFKLQLIKILVFLVILLILNQYLLIILSWVRLELLMIFSWSKVYKNFNQKIS